jgi:hypothetical protein
MTLPGATVLSAVASAFPHHAAQVRYTADTGATDALVGAVASAFCTGLERVRAHTEQGLYNSADGIVRYALADEPAAWGVADAIVGQVVEVLLYGETTWRRVRVNGRHAPAGMVRLNVNAEFAEA